MEVVAKFTCEEVRGGNVRLRAVYDTNPDSENGKFFRYTPYGLIELGLLNESALEVFEPGKEYFVTFKKNT